MAQSYSDSDIKQNKVPLLYDQKQSQHSLFDGGGHNAWEKTEPPKKKETEQKKQHRSDKRQSGNEDEVVRCRNVSLPLAVMF